ncbi:GumC family protein [Ruegeria arenilitoris]|uniref:GumC family protein n=1 Tax=Ruegeria arenilitoris TaxID=1173585 RepID=UPI00147C5DF2|nr:polysaccharide biosynthesis tyrosine autokinase [Ruegeria arenilitoris]
MNLRRNPTHSAAHEAEPHTKADPGSFTYQPIDAMYLFSILRVNARLIAGVAIGCVIAMYIYLLFVPSVYTAYSQVILDTREESISPAEEVVSDLSINSSVLAGEVVTIRSNVLIGKVVDQLGLLEHPQYDPRLPRRENLFSWAKRMVRGGEPTHVIAATMSDDMLRSLVIDEMRKDLTVQQIGVSYAIGISFKNTNPVLAADVANAIANQYIEGQLDAKLDATLRANSWLSDRLAELSGQLEAADAAVVEFKAEMIDIADGNEENINQLLAELNTQLVGSATERADAEVRLTQVEALRTDGGLQAVSDVVTSPLLETLIRQRAELTATQAQLASTLGRKHPDMVRIGAQINNIDRTIDSELQRRVEEMRGDVIVTTNRENALREQIAVVSERADSLAKASVRLGQLERTANATRLVYENFLSRFKETSAQADFQLPEARVIGRAEVPTVPSGPRKTLHIIVAFVFGLSAAIGFVFLRNLIRAPINTANELQDLTHRRNLALLPYVRHFGHKYKWLRREIAGTEHSSFMENVRTIRTSLFALGKARQPKVIMVTSSVPAEGKSSLCCALARTISATNSSVLLLDADLRHPDVRKALALPSDGACLVGYLNGEEKLKDLPVRSELAGADVISPSVESVNAADLLSSNQFAGLLNRMSARYDVVVVNAPPVLYLSDAVLLTKHADTTILAVRSGKTPAKVVSNSIARLEEGGRPVFGTVMTMVRRGDAAAHDLGGYSYKYNY